MNTPLPKMFVYDCFFLKKYAVFPKNIATSSGGAQ